MKGIYVRKRNGKTYYEVVYQAQKKRYRNTFKEINDAKKWLEEIRKEHPQEMQRLPLENERFTDISFSGLKDKNSYNLYIAFDKVVDAYRLVTADQITNKRNLKNRGKIQMNKSGTYSLIMKKKGKQWTVGTFQTKKQTVEKQKQVLHQIALGKPIKIPAKSNTGYRYISKKGEKYCFSAKNNSFKICRYFYTLQEALDFREKYFKENGLEMPKDYIELDFN